MQTLLGAVRAWIDASAAAQKNPHLLANLPCVDLMFALGFAVLGDHVSANNLVESVRKVPEGPAPGGGSAQRDQEVTAALVRNFMFKTFSYRVAQALNGKPLT